jgi:putative transposase
MARLPRIVVPGQPWHIIQRGNNRAACFYAEPHYRRYLDTLQDVATKYACAVHAYLLMTNHVHLLLTPSRHAPE